MVDRTLRKRGVDLLALLLAVMVMVTCVNADTFSAVTNNSTISDESNAQNNETRQKLPDFMPSISDKLSYEEEQRLIKNFTSTPPVPETAMARIFFSKTGFMQMIKIRNQAWCNCIPRDMAGHTHYCDHKPGGMLHMPYEERP